MVEEDEGHFTYADYLGWEDTERCQLINGEVFMMSSPTVAHQGISMELSVQFGNFLRGKPCRVFAAPIDVRLFPEEDKSDDTVVQPDIIVVCDRDKIGKGSINGAPDLVVEILSPSTSSKEMFLKFQSYLEAGVREYWMIDPDEKKVLVHILEEGHYVSSSYKSDAVIPLAVLPDFSLELASIWAAAD
jgi:Uma2 family endonuclease